jgi:Negative regulator of sigma E activity
MSDIKEKISALYDGELDHNEIDDLLKIIDKDPSLQEELSLYSLAGLAIHHDKNNMVSINSSNLENKSIFSNLWFTNGLTAAASILLTLFIINNVDISRMNISEDSTNKIASAINSKEAKDIAERSEEYLIDHILNVINDPKLYEYTRSYDLRK